MLNEIAVSATPAVDSLSSIAQRINDHHGQATRHAKTAIDHARQAGELLLEAKALVNHGEWITWLSDNCDVSPRQCQRYMRVVTHWELIAKNDAASYLTIDDAIQAANNRITVKDDPTSEDSWTRKLEALQPENMLVASFAHGCSFVFAAATNRDYFHHYAYFWLDDCEGGEAQETQRPVLLSATARALSREGFNADEFVEVDRDGFAEHDIKATLPYSPSFYGQMRGSR